MTPNMHLLEINNLKTYFFTPEGTARAVDDVSLALEHGETLGLVGESGCGKSVTALSIMRLLKAPVGRTVAGRIMFQDENLLELSPTRMRKIRGERIGMIFQEPMTSLNPVFTIGDQIAETLVAHKNMNQRTAWRLAVDMLARVQIPSPDKRAKEYPHQLSGGMRQRAMIAMALSCSPALLIADEPTTALDVTIQAQIIDLMLQLKEDFGTAILMITHDLGVIAETAQRVAVMYAGRIVEQAEVVDLFENPRHPYTLGLLNSVPRLGERAVKGRQRLQEIKGIVPSLFDPPPGCSFHPRCPMAQALCRAQTPDLVDVAPGHQARCHLVEPLRSAA
jgi:peptide/nickel transport system ATP-binding protein/oligopeptide transport system ATP-binding protein